MEMPYVEIPKTPVDAVQFFIQEASTVDGEDYGDCMREWNREILFLRSNLENQHVSSWALEKLNRIQEYVQFNPNWHVQSTKERLLKDAEELEEHFFLQANSGPDF